MNKYTTLVEKEKEMKSTLSESVTPTRTLPHLIKMGENIVFVDNDNCACVVGGPDLGKSYGDDVCEWAEYPLYTGTVELSN